MLDKGERVVDSRTNQDLKTFLANQHKGNNKNPLSVNVKIINNGAAVDAKVDSERNGDNVQITIQLLKKMEQIADSSYIKNRNRDMRSGGVFSRA
ncbi:hypothetical protein [Pasteurella canis]|uniref:hypothetical protein n=1 Tax=Pasteurella canis TaxID=753 RepID=UPI001CBC5474|nr:hypothetical protein [Pasteurella canis]UAX42490.1 hypothetical protein K7G89_000307 [Pasteurella canis]